MIIIKINSFIYNIFMLLVKILKKPMPKFYEKNIKYFKTIN